MLFAEALSVEVGVDTAGVLDRSVQPDAMHNASTVTITREWKPIVVRLYGRRVSGASPSESRVPTVIIKNVQGSLKSRR
jgi:hypothetical protein